MPSAELKTPSFLPSVFTSGNLFCGTLAIIEAARGHHLTAAWLVVLAAVFDAIDGMAARLSGHASRFGVEFDSLSDAISFVMAPALIIHRSLFSAFRLWGVLVVFGFVAAGVIRLARFNVSQKNLLEKGAFQGLPVPAAGGVVVSYFIFNHHLFDGEPLFHPALPLALLLLALLMVSRVEYPPLPKLTAKSFRSYLVYIVLLAAVIGLVLRPQIILWPLLLAYILYGLVRSAGRLLAGVSKSPNKGKGKSDRGGVQ